MIDEETKQIFVQESEELLQQMEDALLMMEESPDDVEHLNSVFRAMHTIKGSGGIFGYDSIVSFTHPVETELDRVRSGERQVNPELIAILLKCRDHTASLVQHVAVNSEAAVPQELQEQGDKLLEQLSSREPGAAIVQAEPVSPLEKLDGDVAQSEEHWLIALDFGEDTFRNGFDPLSFIRYLGNLGEIIDITTLLRTDAIAHEMDPESCYLSFHIVLESSADKNAINAVFEFVQDDCEIRIIPPLYKKSEYIELLKKSPESDVKPLGELLIDVGALTARELEEGLEKQEQTQQVDHKPLGEILVKQQVVESGVVDAALRKQETARERASKEARSIRVDAQKLGQLINLVGELVISSASVRTQISNHGLTDVSEAANGMELLVEEIRDIALNLRMVQIGDTFSRFKRVVRDVSSELGKEIELVISGGESELDKSVVEKLNDPLTHLVRNALDHGIEMPETRQATGKPSRGTVALNAYHDSGHIVVEIGDDGAGLDTERIRAKAEAIGLVQPDQVLSRRELLQLIFEPGLSTKKEASNLSGRGVGMDVVKRNIESLRGTVELDSETGKGTRVTIRLPLTLAIIDGFLVRVGSEAYVIPLSMVEECIEFGTEELERDNHYVNFRGSVMPYIHLRHFFRLPTDNTQHRESLVIVRFGRSRAAFVVDELLGEQQTVIKPMGAIFQHLSGISGATVLGSGDVALILNVQGLIEFAEQKAKSVVQPELAIETGK